jgi:hypothetical protein
MQYAKQKSSWAKFKNVVGKMKHLSRAGESQQHAIDALIVTHPDTNQAQR